MLVCKGSNSDHNPDNSWVDFIKKSFSLENDSFSITDTGMFSNCVLFSGESSYTADCWDLKLDTDILN